MYCFCFVLFCFVNCNCKCFSFMCNSVSFLSFKLFPATILLLIIYIQKLLDSDWLKTSATFI